MNMETTLQALTLGSSTSSFTQSNMLPLIIRDKINKLSLPILTKAGIELENHFKIGIRPDWFGEHATTSGLFYNPNVHWISFHGCNDFGYLVKMLTGENLPNKQEQFFQLMKLIFPNFYDLKVAR